MNNIPEIYEVSQLRKDNPQVSFPEVISDEVLSEFNVFKVIETEEPVCDKLVSKTSSSFVKNKNGQWVQEWFISSLDLEVASANIRSVRDNLLFECDWTQLPDAPVDQQAWANYRKSLRDITNNPGFPGSVVWPYKPK